MGFTKKITWSNIHEIGHDIKNRAKKATPSRKNTKWKILGCLNIKKRRTNHMKTKIDNLTR